MNKKTLLIFTLLTITLISGCISPESSNKVNPSRIAPIIAIENNNIHHDLNDPIKAKIGFLQYKGEDFNKIPNFKINGIITNPKSQKYPISIEPKQDKRPEYKYITTFKDTGTEGTYTINITTKAGKDTISTRTKNFVIVKPSTLKLDLNPEEPHRLSATEKRTILKTSESAKAHLKSIASSMGEDTSGIDNIPELNPEGLIHITAEISTGTSIAPSIERPRFTGQMTIQDRYTIEIPSSEFEKWTYIETKDNKAYYENNYILPMSGEYKITLLIMDDSHPVTYTQSENTTITFTLK